MNTDDGETVKADESNLDYVEQKIARLKQALVEIALLAKAPEHYQFYQIADKAIRDN